MALTRRMLTAMGIEAEKIDQIIEAHTESTEALKAKAEEEKAKADELREKASKVPDLEGQIEALKAADESDEWKAKYEQAKSDADKAKADADKLQGEIDSLNAAKDKLQGEFDAYRGDVANEKANAEKLELYKGLLREIGLDEKRVEKAARLKGLDELEVEDGKLKGYDELKASEAEEWAEFIPQSQGTHGQSVPNPPKGGSVPEGADPEIAKMLQQRHADLYGKADE